MERILFETIITKEDRIQQLENYLGRMQGIRNWEIKRLSTSIVIIVEALKICSFELALLLKKKGYPVERVYEE